MTVRTRIALRVLAGALLIIAVVKFMFTMIASFQTEEHLRQSEGYQIDHVFEVNHWAVLWGLAGGVILVVSFVGRRTQARPDEI
jgi:hypothetical protein